jgi:hypothetical protein
MADKLAIPAFEVSLLIISGNLYWRVVSIALSYASSASSRK